MNLIDTYISEVDRQLNRKNKADIEAEIRSTLQDMLDARAMRSGKEIDDELTLEILQEFGSPDAVAASYQGDRYLVGPKLYPAFKKVIQIVLPIMGILALIGLGFSAGRSVLTPGNLFAIVSEAISGFIGAMISALGCITLIFAIIERYVPDLKTRSNKWDARSLLKISPPDRVKVPELIVEIFFTGLAVLVFNFFPQAIGFTPSLNALVESGNTQAVIFIPVLSETFKGFIPFLTVIWILTILLNAFLIQRGQWESWSRWSSVAIKACGIGIAAVMLAVGPSLLAIDVDTLLASGIHTPGTAQILVTLMKQGVTVGLILAILFGSIDLAKAMLNIFRNRPARTIRLNAEK